MFYSHEILTSREHGVATVWLVATGTRLGMGRAARKAILEVNVSGACKTIEKPPGDAPLALCLQANLLYGVVRVYQQQCRYVLNDTEKTTDVMRRFAAGAWDNALVENAGKTKKQHLILLDDPAFDIDFQLPALNLDGDAFSFLGGSQGTAKAFSQLSPLEPGYSSSGRGSFQGGIHIPSSLPSPAAGLPFGGDGPSSVKGHDNMMPFGDEDGLSLGGDLFRIDADGNMIEEPQLPLYPDQQPQDVAAEGAAAQAIARQSGGLPIIGEDDPMLVFEEEPLPDAEALPTREQPQAGAAPGSDQAVAAAEAKPRRLRKAKVAAALEADSETYVARDEFKAWETNYLANAERARKTRHQVSVTTARENARQLIFGSGIANIGRPLGIEGPHTLAELFAGAALQDLVLGTGDGTSPGRRRDASAAFGDEEAEEERRVRPRPDESKQAGRGQQPEEEGILIFEDDLPPVEAGRERGSILSDPLGVPWHRGSSVLHSSVKGSAQKPAVAARHGHGSPLAGRGSILPDIERFSDNLGSDGFAPLHSAPANFSGSDNPMPFPSEDPSQAMRAALDVEGQRFLNFVEGVAREKGLSRAEDVDIDRYWVEFHDLFDAEDKKRSVAAQAFYHVLTLVTKGVLAVEQDGQNKTPFGDIRVGVVLMPGEAEDETLEGFDGGDHHGGQGDDENDEDEVMAEMMEAD